MRAMAHELEPSSEEMRALVDRAMDRIVAYVESLPTQPASCKTRSAELARELAGPIPEDGVAFEQILSTIFDRATTMGHNGASPGFMAYIPGGGLFTAAVADLISRSINRFTGVWDASPGLIQLESNVIRWFCDEVVGYPPTSGGILTSGGSLAHFSAVVAARRDRLPEDFLSGTLYASEEVHHSVAKAAALAGFPAERVRPVAVDDRYGIRLGALRAAVRADRERGWRPFFLIGNAGSTNTGAVDDLAAMADLAREEGLWFHVDAAYGGFFLLTERGRAILRGIERADSLILDPHKSLFLPYGVGSLLVRDAGALRRAHSASAGYLPPMQEEEGFADFSELSPELSRDFRGLRVWLPLMLHGARAFRKALDEKLDLAARACAALRRVPGVEIVAEPQLSLVAFRLHPQGVEGAALDALNEDVLRRVNEWGRVFLSGTRLPCGFVLRLCVLSFRTHAAQIDQAVEDVARAAGELV
jgi:aromatic-L-amino-acid/L-tryptophan decarboxylase